MVASEKLALIYLRGFRCLSLGTFRLHHGFLLSIGKLMSLTNTLLFLILSSLLFNCQDAQETAVPATNEVSAGKKYLVSAAAGDETARATLQFLASGFGQAGISALLKYDVKAYTLTYSTTYKGNPVEASGLIMVPVGMKEKAPIVSLQHGTTFEKDEAPSVRGGFQGMEFFASAGYVTLMPDFIGYGKSASLFHPYYDRKHSASTVIDLIKAAKEFLSSEQILVNDKLFLAGYSEGGYVTLAAAKEIDTNPVHDLKVSAVAAGAGGYDLPEMLQGITRNSYYAYPSYLAFVLMAYNHTYEWNKPLEYFFKDRYADALSKYLTGEYSGGYINSRLTTNVPGLFEPNFFQALHSPEGELELKKALNENSVAGWTTQVPIRMFHGTRDEIIPYQNSEITLEKFRAAGSENVSLTLIQGGTHGNSFERMLREFIPWFLAL